MCTSPAEKLISGLESISRPSGPSWVISGAATTYPPSSARPSSCSEPASPAHVGDEHRLPPAHYPLEFPCRFSNEIRSAGRLDAAVHRDRTRAAGERAALRVAQVLLNSISALGTHRRGVPSAWSSVFSRSRLAVSPSVIVCTACSCSRSAAAAGRWHSNSAAVRSSTRCSSSAVKCRTSANRPALRMACAARPSAAEGGYLRVVVGVGARRAAVHIQHADYLIVQQQRRADPAAGYGPRRRSARRSPGSRRGYHRRRAAPPRAPRCAGRGRRRPGSAAAPPPVVDLLFLARAPCSSAVSVVAQHQRGRVIGDYARPAPVEDSARRFLIELQHAGERERDLAQRVGHAAARPLSLWNRRTLLSAYRARPHGGEEPHRVGAEALVIVAPPSTSSPSTIGTPSHEADSRCSRRSPLGRVSMR